MNATPHLPGDFIVTRTGGAWWDRLAAWAIRFDTDSTVNHAALFIGPTPRHPEGALIEARPRGAGFTSVNSYPEAIWSSGRLPANLTPDDDQRKRIVDAALGMIGTPYGWMDILAIGLAQRRTRETLGRWVSPDRPPWWVRRIADRHTLICSQMIDAEYRDGGIDLYPGRLPGLVSPGDLRDLFEPVEAVA